MNAEKLCIGELYLCLKPMAMYKTIDTINMLREYLEKCWVMIDIRPDYFIPSENDFIVLEKILLKERVIIKLLTTNEESGYVEFEKNDQFTFIESSKYNK